MTREIKIKVWNKDGNEWLGNGEAINLQYSMSRNCFLFDNDSYDIPENIELVEWTGLKDKNGKEIYEGDIVTNTIHNFTTKFGQYGAYNVGFYLNFKDDQNDIDYPICPEIDLEVLGNIYENPELLK